jgi:hypothetical protein
VERVCSLSQDGDMRQLSAVLRMIPRMLRPFFAALLVSMFVSSASAGTKVTLDENGVLEIDGKKTFVFSVSLPPMPGAKSPSGRDGLTEIHDAGVNFSRIRPVTAVQDYTEAGIRSIGTWLDAANKAGIHCWVTLGHLPAVDAKKPDNEKLLRLAIELYKDHPALGAWKGFDEPAWVKQSPEPMIASYKLFHQLDPNHPVIIIQAPMKASLPLASYVPTGDIFGVDIYPVTYPPGNHSDLPNKEISLVADWTKIIRDAVKPKPIWMTLQIAWAGTATEGKTLRFPTFAQQRYMAYAAIINGARGINFQGGERPLSLNERDSKLGWNWTYFDKVMRLLLEELGENSPMQPALVAANSKLPVKLRGADDIDFVVREAGSDIYILAAKREGKTVKVTFSGLPVGAAQAAAMFEEPRKVQIKGGEFEDWFGPDEVHIYRIKR